MPTARRRIKKARITHLSLCPMGKNRLPVLFKSDEDSGNLTLEFQTLLKEDQEEGTITAIVWPGEMPDSTGDVASVEVVKEMSYGFMRELASGEGGLDLRHNLETIDPEDAFIAESFIVQKGDPRFIDMKDRDGDLVDVTGAWATVIKLDSEKLKNDYRSGEWNGVSMYGQALVEPVAKSEFDLDMAASRVFDAMADRLSSKIRNGEIDVDADKLLEILAKRDETLMATLKKELDERLTKEQPAPTPATPAPVAPAKPESEGMKLVAPILKAEDVGNPEKLAAYHKALHTYKRASLVKWDDADSVAEYMAELEKEEPEEKKISKSEDKPRVPSTQAAADPDPEQVKLRKEEHDTASRIARAAGSVTGVGSFADEKKS